MSLSTTSKWFLNTSRVGDSTTSLRSPFQCLTALSVKKCFLISNLNLPWCNLRPFPLILSHIMYVIMLSVKYFRKVNKYFYLVFTVSWLQLTVVFLFGADIKVHENEDNTAVINSVADAHKLVRNKFLPSVQSWIQVG